MPVEVEFQPIVDKYAKALRGPSLLFELWPTPRTRGRPAQRYSALCSAVVLGVSGAFEAFAEDLLAAVLIRQGHGWAHVAANADLTNPSVKTLRNSLSKFAGIDVASPVGWTIDLPTQLNDSTTWNDRPYMWGDVLDRSESWIEVRHCLAHGAVTGIGGENWPGPVSRRSHATSIPTANDDQILARLASDPAKRALYLWPTISCARIFSAGATVIASVAAAEFGESIDTNVVPDFLAV